MYLIRNSLLHISELIDSCGLRCFHFHQVFTLFAWQNAETLPLILHRRMIAHDGVSGREREEEEEEEVEEEGGGSFQLIRRSQPRLESAALWLPIIAKCEQRQLADETIRQCQDMPPKRLVRQPSHQTVMIMC